MAASSAVARVASEVPAAGFAAALRAGATTSAVARAGALTSVVHAAFAGPASLIRAEAQALADPELQLALPPALQSPLESHPHLFAPQLKPLTHASPQPPHDAELAETLASQPSSAPADGCTQLP